MPKYKCEFCGRPSPRAQGLAAHVRWCPKNPKAQKPARRRRPKAELEPTDGSEPEVRRKRRSSKLDAFVMEQNVETATAYVIAAKFPTGVPVADIPRVVRLVKAVEHG